MSPRASSPALSGNPVRNSCPASPGTPEAPRARVGVPDKLKNLSRFNLQQLKHATFGLSPPCPFQSPAVSLLEHAGRQSIVLDWRASSLGVTALGRAAVNSP